MSDRVPMWGQQDRAARTLVRAEAITRFGVLLIAAALLAPGCGSRPSSVTPLAPPPITGTIVGDPAILCERPRGDVLLAWVAGDSSNLRLWFSRSADRGEHWTAPVAVTPPGEPLELNPGSPPRLVADAEHRIGISWSTSVRVPGLNWRASDLRFARSLDGGAHWDPPATVNDDTAAGPGRHGFHDVALLPNGALLAAWVDSRPVADGTAPNDPSEGEDASIQLAQSLDFGGRWSPNEAHGSHVSPDCRVSIGVDIQGFSFITYRKHSPGQIRDVVLAGFKSPPVSAYSDHWSVASPRTNSTMEMSHDGTIRVAWYTGAAGRTGVWFRQGMPATYDSTFAPMPILVGPNIGITRIGIADAGMGGSVIAMDSDSTGARQLTLARVSPPGTRMLERFTVPGTSGASHPHVAALNTRPDAYVVWTQEENGAARLKLLRWSVGH